jgi:adenine-specific DNA-methyltransferase
VRIVGSKRSDDQEPESRYADIADAQHRKALGQFFTPPDVAEIMAEWISGINPSTVLDPAVGPGVLLLKATQKLPKASFIGIDVDSAPLGFARARLGSESQLDLRQGDFLEDWHDGEVDAVICNPPYVRHHLLKYDNDVYAAARTTIPKLSKNSNLYVLFVAAIWQCLRDGGRASILLPADWMNSNYGVPFKAFLAKTDSVRRIIYFTNEFTLFEDALSTAVLLLLEKSVSHVATEVITVTSSQRRDITSLGEPNVPRLPGSVKQEIKLRDLETSQKWDRIFRGTRKDTPESWVRLGEVAVSRRGIATGANNYFHLSKQDLSLAGLSLERTRRCVGKASDVKGQLFQNHHGFFSLTWTVSILRTSDT